MNQLKASIHSSDFAMFAIYGSNCIHIYLQFSAYGNKLILQHAFTTWQQLYSWKMLYLGIYCNQIQNAMYFIVSYHCWQTLQVYNTRTLMDSGTHTYTPIFKYYHEMFLQKRINVYNNLFKPRSATMYIISQIIKWIQHDINFHFNLS